MAAHSSFPPPGIQPIVRGDPAAMVVRFMDNGIDQDISGWTFQSMVREYLDGPLVDSCEAFDVLAADDVPDLFPDAPGAVPAVLVAHWTAEQTSQWRTGMVADIEQLTPTKRTWVIFDQFQVDADVSNATGAV
jgi:hypothetical protein